MIYQLSILDLDFMKFFFNLLTCFLLIAITDLAWSPDSRILLSVGTANDVFLWDCVHYPNKPLSELTNHTAPVKGAVFDPGNQYFATGSDDGTFQIISYSWVSKYEIKTKVYHTNTKIYNGSALTTRSRRCSWSPDGSHIAVSGSINGRLPAVSIVERKTGESDISLLGHDKPCEVAKFAPRVFLTDPDEESENYFTVIATAGEDRSLAIWSTLNPRPLVVTRDICSKTITDISWTTEGNILYCTSLDGSINIIIFEIGELGIPGKISLVNNNLSKFDANPNCWDKLFSMPSPKNEVIILDDDGDIEMVHSDKVPTSDVALDTGLNSSSNTKPKPKPNSTPNTKPNTNLSINSNKIENETTDTNNDIVQYNTKIITKNGKKRITPMLVSSKNGTTLSLNNSKLSNNTNNNNINNNNKISKIANLEFSKPSHLIPSDSTTPISLGMKRKEVLQEQGDENNNTTNGSIKRRPQEKEEVVEYIKNAVINPVNVISQVRLSTPKVRSLFSINGSTSSTNNNGNTDIILEVKNGSGNEQVPSRITASKKGKPVFTDFVPRHILLATGGYSFWSICTEDGVVQTYSFNGRRLLPPMVLGSSLSFLESQGPYLLAITNTGMVHSWNMIEKKALHTPVSILPILDSSVKYGDDGIIRGSNILQCSINNNGIIVITLSNGNGYIYNSSMQTWQRITDSWWIFGSHYWNGNSVTNSNNVDSKTSSEGIIGMVEKKTNDEFVRKGRSRMFQTMAKSMLMREGFEGFENIVSIAHLENRFSASIILGDPEELKQTLIMYSRRIADEGMKERLQELCIQLMGPTVILSKSDEKWDNKICGIPKRELLKEVILATAKNREMQRVLTSFAQAIGLLDL